MQVRGEGWDDMPWWMPGELNVIEVCEYNSFT